MRIKQYHAIPEKWFVAGTIEYENGEEYSFAVLRLPSYQLLESWIHRRPCWHQLAITYHGREGFRIEWLLCTAPGKGANDAK